MNNITISIPKNILNSLLIAVLAGFVIIFLGHLITDNWLARPISNSSDPRAGIPFSSPIQFCSYKCLFGERHGIDCKNLTLGDCDESSLSYTDRFMASFEHLGFWLLTSIIIFAAKELSKKVKFKFI